MSLIGSGYSNFGGELTGLRSEPHSEKTKAKGDSDQPHNASRELQEIVIECNRQVSEMNKFKLNAEAKLQRAKDSHDVMLGALIECQGLLSQFKYPEIRRAFLDGKFLVAVHSEEVLRSLDIISGILLPVPSLLRNEDRRAIDFAEKLLSKDESEPTDEQGSFLPFRQSFSYWKMYMQSLLISPMVISVPTSPPPVNHLTDPRLHDQKELKTSRGSSVWKYEEEKSTKMRGKSKFNPRWSSSQSSSSDEDGKSIKSEYCGSSVSKNGGRREERHDAESSFLRVLETLKKPKEVIPPSPFDAGDARSLSKFLASFERYFDSRYEGTEREKSTQLSKFLKGPSKTAYDAIGGSAMKYSKLKPKLLDWYDSQKTSPHEARLIAFSESRMQPGDSCGIYCLRLEKLAALAFKDSSKEYERQLLRKMRETGPPALVRKLIDAQSMLLITNGEKLTWAKMKRLAEDHDRSTSINNESVTPVQDGAFSAFFNHREAKMMEATKQQNILQEEGQSHQVNPLEERIETNSSHANRSYRGRYPGFRCRGRSSRQDWQRDNAHQSMLWIGKCMWCGRQGHSDKDCWERRGACRSCGELTHWVANCPRRNKEEDQAVCPICEGCHLGRYCHRSSPKNLN